MSPKRNSLEQAAERVAESLVRMGPPPGQRPAVPFGFEQLASRDYANRVYGGAMTPDQRRAELQRGGRQRMVEAARTYQRQHPGKVKQMIPPGNFPGQRG